MKKEVLICVGISYSKDQCKISAIKDPGWKWGTAELDTSKFKIISFDLSEDQLKSIRENKLCVNTSSKQLVATPETHWLKRSETKSIKLLKKNK